MATHSSVLVLRIPGTGEPGGLPSVGSHRVGHDRSDLAAAAELINNVKLVSGVQQSDSIICNTCIFFFKFFAPSGYYRVLRRVPCAVQ